MQFEDVYKLYYRDVYYYLLSMTGDAQTAEDLTQETFIQGIQSASVTFSSDNKRFKRTPKSDKVLGDQTKKL